MNYVTLGIYIIASILHLFMFRTKNKKLITITKALLMPLLTLFYITGSSSVNLFILMALLFGWLGDVFLTGMSQVKFFICGIIFFLLGHVMYSYVFWNYVTEINYLAAFVTFLVIFAVSFIIYTYVKGSLGKMKPAATAYVITISFMLFSAFMFLFSNFFLAGFLVIIGAAFFFTSDSLIAVSEFKHHFKHEDFIIMSTYILAQLFIICGLLVVGTVH